MAFEVVVPQMGESVLEGTIVEWKVAVGDRTEVNQPLVEIMTDKVNIEIPSEVDGIIEKLLVEPGEVVEVGKVICTIATEGEVSVKASVPEKKPATAETPAARAAKAPAAPVKASGKKPKMAPAVRKLVREYGLDPAQITGTGPDGRLTKEDVQKAAAARSSVSSAAASTPAPAAPVKPTPSVQSATPPPGVPFPSYVPPALGEGDRMEERLPLEGARKMISEHMTRSVQISSHVTT
ncbi:MAG: HlyD family efflux transporter periplasmic adaptor subunit, partial [FCB group bacterium]|nr:HlyD family efflux transporter periplasmic adaptor subunit [FCB group bacterium]